MAHSTEVGAELEADHRLIELLSRQLDLEADASRRQAMADRIAGIIDWHETFDRRYLGSDEPADDAGEDRDQAGLGPADLGGTRAQPPRHEGEAMASVPLQSLLARAREHIREEEEHTLPDFESHAHWMILEDLGERARELRLARTGQ